MVVKVYDAYYESNFEAQFLARHDANNFEKSQVSWLHLEYKLDLKKVASETGPP